MSENLKLTVQIQQSEGTDTKFETYECEADPSAVMLDVVRDIQTNQAPELAIRWNCKAGKCGSCSAEVNGMPKLLCMSRVSDLDLSKPIVVTPLRSFPLVKDLVTDVSWAVDVNRRIKPYAHPEGEVELNMMQEEIERVKEFRKCIECYLCNNVCHVIREHGRLDAFAGPRFMVRLANLEMHPRDTADRIPEIKNEFGIGLCNITKCCTEVCPEDIPITDEAIIPLKERVVSRYYDPIAMLVRFVKKIF